MTHEHYLSPDRIAPASEPSEQLRRVVGGLAVDHCPRCGWSLDIPPPDEGEGADVSTASVSDPAVDGQFYFTAQGKVYRAKTVSSLIKIANNVANQNDMDALLDVLDDAD